MSRKAPTPDRSGTTDRWSVESVACLPPVCVPALRRCLRDSLRQMRASHLGRQRRPLGTEAVAQTTSVGADSNAGSAGAGKAGTPVPVRVDDPTTKSQLTGFVRHPRRGSSVRSDGHLTPASASKATAGYRLREMAGPLAAVIRSSRRVGGCGRSPNSPTSPARRRASWRRKVQCRPRYAAGAGSGVCGSAAT
jgi:hypothetical protein